MRIAVTGATGNLGSAVLRRIARENDAAPGSAHQVLGISRRAPEPPGSVERVEWVQIDLEAPSAFADLRDALRGYDAVAHFAWKLQPAHDEQQLRRTNIGGTRAVLRAAAAAHVAQIVVASSVGAYSASPKDSPVPESWPVDGIPASSYSRHKSEVEHLLDEFEYDHPDITLARIRPALIFQSEAASEIARLFLGHLVPTRLIGVLRPPVLPLSPQLVFQAVHADDVAAAVWLILEHRAAGPFNIATAPILGPDDLARALGARRAVPLPLGLLRGLVAATWHARLQPTEPGWIDLAGHCPVMSTARLSDLGWKPERSSHEALAELVAGIRGGQGNNVYPPLVTRHQS